jgi:hypothetical protein
VCVISPRQEIIHAKVRGQGFLAKGFVARRGFVAKGFVAKGFVARRKWNFGFSGQGLVVKQTKLGIWRDGVAMVPQESSTGTLAMSNSLRSRVTTVKP